jgi:2-polyprenyl-3-methyl-5-hydroxy-6-metoxy-1,4-benzoquinol methylase
VIGAREIITDCLLCGRAGETVYSDLIDRLETEEGEFGIQRCSHCAFQWLSPRPRLDEMAKFYPHNYYAYQVSAGVDPSTGLARGLREQIRRLILSEVFEYAHLGVGNERFSFLGRLFGMVPFLRRRAAFEWEEFLPHYIPNGRLLDIGCGAGTYLARMRALGWDVQGVDLSQDAAKVAQHRYGISVKVGMLPEVRFPDDMFSVVTMSHVIEHVPDPLVYLAECRRIIISGGHLIINTPNMISFASRMFGRHWVALDPPRHLVLFTPATLRQCVQRAGFKVVRERSYPYLAGYNAQLSFRIRQHGHVRNYTGMSVRDLECSAKLVEWVERALLLLWPWAGNELRLVAVKP